MATKNPKDFDLVEVLKQNIKDSDKVDEIVEAVDVDGVKKAVDEDYTNPIVSYRTQQTRDKAKEELQGEIKDDIVKDIGIEDVENADQLKSWAKRIQSNTTEKDEELARVQKELEQVKPEYEKVKGEAEKMHSLRTIEEKGFSSDYAEDVYTLAKSRATEDQPLEQVLDSMKESHQQFLAKPSVGARLGQDDDDPDSEEQAQKEVEEWEKQYGVENIK